MATRLSSSAARAHSAARAQARGAALVLALGLVALLASACDSDDEDGDLSELDGSYVATQFRFDANNTDDFDVDLIDELNNPPRLEIVASDQFFFLRYGSQSLRGNVSRSNDVIRFNVEQGAPDNVLLPNNFRVKLQSNGEVLAGGSAGNGISLNGVDLSRYGIEQGSVDGKLRVRFERR